MGNSKNKKQGQGEEISRKQSKEKNKAANKAGFKTKKEKRMALRNSRKP